MIRVDESDPVGEIEPPFPYRDVVVRRVNFKDHYDLQTELGRGKFGTVYQCKEKQSGLRLAAKIVNTTKKEDRRDVEREVEIMRRLQHPRLIQLYDAIDNDKKFYVILELIEGGELFERVIDDDFYLTERSCAVFMRQICEGIEFVHAQNVLHLDMKPENILCLTKEGNRIKIIDFGLAREYDPKKKLQVLFGTPEFVSPEVVNFDEIGYGTDMWSIGVICYVLLSGLSPFMGDTDVETMANVTIAKYDFDHEAFADISEDAKDFIRSLLIKDKEKRATAAQCQTHPWIVNPGASVVKKSVETKEEVKEVEKKKKKKKKKKPEVKEKPVKVKPTVLDVTKDNLRLFVERWREHPNSPYMLEHLDTLASLDSNVLNKVESMSLSGQSPSPPQSICSSASEVSDTPRNTTILNIPTLGFERRASEGNSKASNSRDPAAQIVLAEEIIKLSEHLRSIAASSSTQREEEVKTKLVGEKIRRAEVPSEMMKTVEEKTASFSEKKTRESSADGLKSRLLDRDSNSEVNEISEKLSTITRQRKLNGTTFNGSRHYERQESNSGTFTLKRSSSRLNEALLSRENTRNEEESRTPRSWRSDMRDELLVCDKEREMTRENGEIDLTPPWRKPRIKRRFGETCRDVPRISNLRDLHKSIDFDEPTSTKDLLLQLLGEWEERPGSGKGRKSISVDWVEDSIARRSINSLAEYFQSEQKKSIKTAVSNSSVIHR
ncbi:calcium/calmodulin-dependent protein kinase type II subunit gamma [Diachasma alloeum]|uniref:calcium/calmodulin-dependent protein kinase type II subunit gamma n=1 Tax=Diachasma alloeum TaxID=454923 RepID=UPI0007383547|nr:calcium/calmodulin-dependent protein kinase type II subunit gamma [Diachasma alloeum]